MVPGWVLEVPLMLGNALFFLKSISVVNHIDLASKAFAIHGEKQARFVKGEVLLKFQDS